MVKLTAENRDELTDLVYDAVNDVMRTRADAGDFHSRCGSPTEAHIREIVREEVTEALGSMLVEFFPDRAADYTLRASEAEEEKFGLPPEEQGL